MLAAVLSLVVIVAVAVAVQRRHGTARPVASTPTGGSSRSTSAPSSASAPSSSGGASNGACTALRVVAASSIAPALRQVAATLATGPDCVAVTVTIADGEGASSVVARDHADVWVPDDSAWLNLPVAAALAPGNGAVIATSPLYFVTAKGSALPSKARTWLGLGDTLATRGRLKLVLADPAASGAALVGAGALVDAGIDANGPLISALDVMRAWQAGRTVAGTAPAFPNSSGEVGIVAEYALLSGAADRYNVSVPGGAESPYLRYTWHPTVTGAAQNGQALSRLQSALTSAAGRTALAGQHLRPGDRTPIPATAGARASLPDPPGEPTPVIAEHYLYHVLTTFHPSRRKANILVVIDVSGSMGKSAPHSSQSLIAVVRSGVSQLTDLMPATSHIGLWEFGSRLDGRRDYRSLVPTGKLSVAQRKAVDGAADHLKARATGTGLYDTILAAYRHQQDNFQPGMPNEVLVFTDGKDQDDPGGISLASLRSSLAAADPGRHVQVGVLGFGNQLPITSLTHALGPVDGQVDRLTNTPDVIGAFVHAVSGGLTH
jgi:Bacterial extracellular solute-binding protein/von Willebrand factor type A domain